MMKAEDRVLRQGDVMSRMTVGDLMTEVVYSLTPGDDLAAVQELMWEYDIRHVPIVDDVRRVVGIVSQRDLARVQSQAEAVFPISARLDFLKNTTVSEVMTRDVATIGPEDELRAAAQTMFDCKYGCLPVVTDDQLVGILTEADFVRLMAEEN